MNNHFSNLVVTLGFVQPNGHGDSKAPVVESDLGRGYVRGIDDQTYVAAQVGQCFSAGEAFP